MYVLQSGRTPLHKASEKWNNKQVVDVLIKADANVNIADKVSYYQAPYCIS